MATLFKIPILENSNFELSKLDFSFIKFSIVNIEDFAFRKFITEISGKTNDDLDYVFDLINENKSRFPKYAILKNDFDTKDKPSSCKYISPEEVFKFLLIINPSLQLRYQIIFDFNDRIFSLIGLQSLMIYPIEDELIIDNQVNSINRFAIKYFKIKNNKLIKNITDNYYNSFLTNQKNFQYLSLFTCLENLISGTFELAYRLQRTCAILSSDDTIKREQIFKNVKKLKEFRNTMVHGGSYNSNELNTNLSYLRNLVSVLIVRLFHIDNKTFLQASYDVVKINDWITAIGFSENLFKNPENCLDDAILNISRKKIINTTLK